MAGNSLKELIARSSVAFVGTVRSLGQSPEPGLEADERTALVQLEQPLHAPEQVDLSPGQLVVVQLDAGQPVLEPGTRATFFTDPVIYGNTLVVREVARSEGAEAVPAHAAASMPAAVGEIERDAVIEHARAADAVVRGHVVALRAAESTPHREHDPHWWVATLEVDLVAQGDVPGVGDDGGQVDVLYANSLDRRWRSWPKPKAGQSGMWILHRTEGDHAQPFELMHPQDLQPSVMLDALLGEAPDDDPGDEPQ